jgi:hypothetical protein
VRSVARSDNSVPSQTSREFPRDSSGDPCVHGAASSFAERNDVDLSEAVVLMAAVEQ